MDDDDNNETSANNLFGERSTLLGVRKSQSASLLNSDPVSSQSTNLFGDREKPSPQYSTTFSTITNNGHSSSAEHFNFGKPLFGAKNAGDNGGGSSKTTSIIAAQPIFGSSFGKENSVDTNMLSKSKTIKIESAQPIFGSSKSEVNLNTNYLSTSKDSPQPIFGSSTSKSEDVILKHDTKDLAQPIFGSSNSETNLIKTYLPSFKDPAQPIFGSSIGTNVVNIDNNILKSKHDTKEMAQPIFGSFGSNENINNEHTLIKPNSIDQPIFAQLKSSETSFDKNPIIKSENDYKNTAQPIFGSSNVGDNISLKSKRSYKDTAQPIFGTSASNTTLFNSDSLSKSDNPYSNLSRPTFGSSANNARILNKETIVKPKQIHKDTTVRDRALPIFGTVASNRGSPAKDDALRSRSERFAATGTRREKEYPTARTRDRASPLTAFEENTAASSKRREHRVKPSPYSGAALSSYAAPRGSTSTTTATATTTATTNRASTGPARQVSSLFRSNFASAVAECKSVADALNPRTNRYRVHDATFDAAVASMKREVDRAYAVDQSDASSVSEIDTDDEDESSVLKRGAPQHLISVYDVRGRPKVTEYSLQRHVSISIEDDMDDERGIFEAPVFKRIVANTLAELEAISSNTTEERLAAHTAYDELVQKHVEPTGQGIVGTCEDMCPERERYTREFQHRISRFELLPDSDERTTLMDHSLAVKEYSRSSADQEVPLPSALRTIGMLEYSMNYLLSNVADQGGEGNWEGWFDFLWDRTRAIRKDLIQQELCEHRATVLIEKCTRFHIYSCCRLCEEEPPVYDNKINDENLTKCLQTLKEFYALSRDQPLTDDPVDIHENEFRAYILLMNLPDADCMREIYTLPKFVVDSPEVQFAIEVFRSYSHLNYVRFFSLLRRATFMQACLMNRYVQYMHNEAMRVLQVTYDPNELNEISFSKLKHQLAITNNREFLFICNKYGMTLHIDTQMVEFRNDNFITYEEPTHAARRFHFIENMISTTIGEAINGGELPLNRPYLPDCSFDQKGYFIKGYPDPPAPEVFVPIDMTQVQQFVERVYTSDEDEETATAAREERDEQTRRKKERRAEKRRQNASHQGEGPGDVSAMSDSAMFRYLEEEQLKQERIEKEELELEREERRGGGSSAGVIQANYARSKKSDKALHYTLKEVTKDMINELLDEQIKSYLNTMLNKASFVTSVFISHLIHAAIQPLTRLNMMDEMAIRRIAVDVMKTAHLAQLAGPESPERLPLSESSTSASEERVFQLLLSDNTRSVARDAHKAIESEHHACVSQTQQAQQHTTLNSALDALLSELCAEIAVTVHTTQVVEPLRRVDAFAARQFKQRYSSTLNTWVDRYHSHRLSEQFRKRVDNPNRPSSTKEALDLLLPFRRPENDSERCVSIGQNTSLFIKQNQDLTRYNDQIGEGYQQKMATIHRKIDLLKLFTEKITRINGHLSKNAPRYYFKLVLSSHSDDNHWIRSKFTDDAPKEEQINVLYIEDTANVCVTEIRGEICSDEIRVLKQMHILAGTSALLFVLNSRYTDKDSYWLKESQRLFSLAMSLPQGARVPLVIVATFEHAYTTAEVSSKLSIDGSRLIDTKISDVVVVDFTDTTFNNCVKFEKIMKNLVMKCPAELSPLIGFNSIVHYIDSRLELHFYKRVCLHHNQNPYAIISLFNECVDHMINELTNDVLAGTSYPVYEFASLHKNLPDCDWNDIDRLNDLRETLATLYLRVKTAPPPVNQPTTIEEQWRRLDAVVASVCDQACKPHKRYNAEVIHDSMYNAMIAARQKFSNRNGATWSHNTLPHWLLDINWLDIVNHLIRSRLDNITEYDGVGKSSQVYVLKDHLLAFTEPSDWLDLLQDTTPTREVIICPQQKNTEKDNHRRPLDYADKEEADDDDFRLDEIIERCETSELQFESYVQSRHQKAPLTPFSPSSSSASILLSGTFSNCDRTEDFSLLFTSFSSSSAVTPPPSSDLTECKGRTPTWKRPPPRSIEELRLERKRQRLLAPPPVVATFRHSHVTSATSEVHLQCEALDDTISKQGFEEVRLETKLLRALNDAL